MEKLQAPQKTANILKFLNGKKGIAVEIGVYQGGSISIFAEANPEIQFYGYDTFEGLPQETELDNCHKIGEFSCSLETAKQNIKATNVKLIKGRFPFSDTENLQNILLAHVDVDLYQDTKNCLEYLYPRLAPGGRIYIDDAFWKGTKGATIAVCEFCGANKLELRLDRNKHAYIKKENLNEKFSKLAKRKKSRKLQ